MHAWHLPYLGLERFCACLFLCLIRVLSVFLYDWCQESSPPGASLCSPCRVSFCDMHLVNIHCSHVVHYSLWTGPLRWLRCSPLCLVCRENVPLLHTQRAAPSPLLHHWPHTYLPVRKFICSLSSYQAPIAPVAAILLNLKVIMTISFAKG